MVQGRTITVAAASDADVRRADELRLEWGQGSGVEAILTRRNFRADDLRLNGRWRFWERQAARLGWLSVMSVPLADGDTLASLTVYSRQVRSFSHVEQAVAEAFAGHAVAVGNAREQRSVSEAVTTRRVLRLAQAMLMKRLQVDAEQAFTVLRRSAAQGNQRVAEVAADVVAGRVMTGNPSPSLRTDAAS